MASPLGLVFDSSPSSVNIGQYRVVNSKAIKSLFGNSQFSPFPSGADPETGNVNGIRAARDVHNDEIYDTSIASIVDYSSKYPGMKLSFADFAYLKDVGVYPNNRLMIARRFPSGVGNDLTSVKTEPMATLISWVKDGEEYMSVDYSEVWTEAEASFENVLNDMGKDLKASQDQGTQLGSLAASGFMGVPLPGFMEGIQYEVMRNMGITDKGVGNSPLGNPNMIREAKRRTTLAAGEAGSGLVAKVSVKMTVEYEQKFINGIDPSLVYLDIIQNALTFGTSDSNFQFNGAFAQGTKGFIADLISGDVRAIARALQQFVASMLSAIAKVGKQLLEALISPPSGNELPNVDDLFAFIQKAFASTIGHVVSKYKVRLIGIANALTGSPSAPWHVTIGNPKKPIFSSGDMVCDNVQLSVGKNLAFNDLPSYIKIEATFTNARNLGAQEIYNRFNTGRGRSYVRLRQSYVEVPDNLPEGTGEWNATTNGQGQAGPTPTNSPTVKPDEYLVNFDSSNGSPYLEQPADTATPFTSPIGPNGSTLQSAVVRPTGADTVAGIERITPELAQTLPTDTLSNRLATVNRELSATPPIATDSFAAENGRVLQRVQDNPVYTSFLSERDTISRELANRVPLDPDTITP